MKPSPLRSQSSKTLRDSAIWFSVSFVMVIPPWSTMGANLRSDRLRPPERRRLTDSGGFARRTRKRKGRRIASAPICPATLARLPADVGEQREGHVVGRNQIVRQVAV